MRLGLLRSRSPRLRAGARGRDGGAMVKLTGETGAGAWMGVEAATAELAIFTALAAGALRAVRTPSQPVA